MKKSTVEIPSTLFDGDWKIDHLTVRVRGMTDMETSDGRGFFFYRTNEITINQERSLAEQLEVFFHEITHAYVWTRGVWNGDRKEDQGLSQEEYCCFNGRFLATFFLQNPKAVKLIATIMEKLLP